MTDTIVNEIKRQKENPAGDIAHVVKNRKKSPIEQAIDEKENAKAVMNEYNSSDIEIDPDVKKQIELDAIKEIESAIQKREEMQQALHTAENNRKKEIKNLFDSLKQNGFKDRFDYNKYYIWNFFAADNGRYAEMAEQGVVCFEKEKEAVDFLTYNKALLKEFVVKDGVEIANSYLMKWIKIAKASK